ncbi:MAG: ABC transporter permease subunit [Candidatus Izemoplasmatales bacterium]|nr:ABC transporter permease subunit [Candidatus Izemoplasmatales bacterium]MDD4069529.1 ABC transporter permease subunit [Candidatus Izemoplasmatales bacterium]
MKNIITIFKKEWDRVIQDRRLVIMVILLPGILIYTIYSFMGAMMNNQEQEMTDIAIVNPTDGFTNKYQLYENDNYLNVIEINESQVEEYQNMIDEEEWTILIVFPEGIEDYDGSGEPKEVTIYYNPNVLASSNVSNRFIEYLIEYQEDLFKERFDDKKIYVLNQTGTTVDESQLMGSILGQLLPMLVIMFLFSGAMSIGPESIAGEKERNTLSTILITPIKRKELALGKILGLSVLSLLSAVSSFLGIILSLPKLMNYQGANLSIYGFNDYILIFLILFSTIFVIIGIISILSAFAKSVKEASTYITPIYILTIIVSISSSFGTNNDPHILRALIPIINSVDSLKMVMTFSDNVMLFTLITVLANLVYLTGFVFILNKMFNNERIMFAK